MPSYIMYRCTNNEQSTNNAQSAVHKYFNRWADCPSHMPHTTLLVGTRCQPSESRTCHASLCAYFLWTCTHEKQQNPNTSYAQWQAQETDHQVTVRELLPNEAEHHSKPQTFGPFLRPGNDLEESTI